MLRLKKFFGLILILLKLMCFLRIMDLIILDSCINFSLRSLGLYHSKNCPYSNNMSIISRSILRKTIGNFFPLRMEKIPIPMINSRSDS